MVVKIAFEGTVKRVYDETRGTRTNKYMVVTDGNEKYPNVLRFKSKGGAAIAANEGDEVKVEAYLDGREWVPTDGRDPMYFTDLTISSVEVLKAASKPTTATSWQELLALGKAYGEDQNALVARCKAHMKPFKEMAASDWQAIAAEIVAAHPETAADDFPAEDPDDMPF